MNIREQIKKDLLRAISDQRLEVSETQVEVTRTADSKNGDYSTNVAMKLVRHSGDERSEDSRIPTGADSGQAMTLRNRRVSGSKIATQRSVGMNVARNDGVKSSHSPLEIAKLLADSMVRQHYVAKVEVAGPGFINFFLKDEIWQDVVEVVLKKGEKYGCNEGYKGKKARVEFVSANPTGPLHFGNARGGPIGDVLARVLEASGYEVLREYIHNDVGEQVRKLGESIINVAKGEKLEDQEYKGTYIKELVDRLSLIGNLKSPMNDELLTIDVYQVGKQATDLMLDETLADCEAMGIKFDKVFPESGFVESGDTKRAIAELEEKGFIKQKDGAKWFAPHLRQGSSGRANDEFLKDRETVVVKSDGSYTYFSNDIAYHKIKFSEGYDLVVDIFGANHHGHVPRLQAVIKALGGDVSRFHAILYQWVRFKKGGELLAMSKRSGNFVTAREVLEMVGSDAVRFFVLMHDANSHIDFDLDLAREKSSKNPVFYVQYAHARICSILAKAKAAFPVNASGAKQSISSHPEVAHVSSSTRLRIHANKSRGFPIRSGMTGEGGSNGNLGLLTTEYELNLIKKVSKLPELVEDISHTFAVNALTTYAMELADAFHKFYEHCRVLPQTGKDLEGETSSKSETGGEQIAVELTIARLALVDATRITLANTLNLLGISAPEKM